MFATAANGNSVMSPRIRCRSSPLPQKPRATVTIHTQLSTATSVVEPRLIGLPETYDCLSIPRTVEGVSLTVYEQLPEIIDGVMTAMTFGRQTEVQAWEQEIIPCEHTLCLEQSEAKQLESQSLWFLGKLSGTVANMPRLGSLCKLRLEGKSLALSTVW
jgi:hypothetical protein